MSEFLHASSSPRPGGRLRQGTALLAAGGVLLGTIGIFLEEAGQHPLTAVWFRCAFGLLVLSAWGFASARLAELRLWGRGLAAALAAGGLMILSWALFFGAIAQTSIAVATVVFHVQPFWILLLASCWLDERVQAGQLASAAVALAGLALAAGLFEPGRGAVAMEWNFVLGLAMCLAGSLCYAAVTLIARSATRVSPFALAWWQCAVGTVVLAWWPWWSGWPAAGAAWFWLAGLGVLHTGLAYFLIYGGMARLPAGRIALLQFVYPATAVLVDWAVFGRALGPWQWAGVGAIALALAAMRSAEPRPAPVTRRAAP